MIFSSRTYNSFIENLPTSSLTLQLRTPFLANIKRHHESACHQKALKKVGSYDLKQNAAELAVAGCPPLSMFSEALASRMRRDSLQCGLSAAGEKVCGREKLHNLQFCLAEAAREETRKWLQEAVMMSIMQDSRQGQLLMSYCCVDQNLSVRKGLLGCIDVEYSETITNIVAAMEEVVRLACAGGSDDLEKSVREKVTMFVADAASNEQGAGRVSKQIFPNVISCVRDRAHACMRVLKRPWDAVSSMGTILDQYVFGGDSIIQKIHHSKCLQDVFGTFAQKLDPAWQKRIRHLKAAKHRFASCTQPLQRMVVYLDAIVSTLVWISTQREGPDKQAALDFLDAMHEKDLVLMAMMSDLADEASQLLRLVDTENYDISEFPAEVDALIARLHHLVNKGHIFEQGFTEHMIAALEHPRGFMVLWAMKLFILYFCFQCNFKTCHVLSLMKKIVGQVTQSGQRCSQDVGWL